MARVNEYDVLDHLERSLALYADGLVLMDEVYGLWKKAKEYGETLRDDLFRRAQIHADVVEEYWAKNKKELGKDGNDDWVNMVLNVGGCMDTLDFFSLAVENFDIPEKVAFSSLEASEKLLNDMSKWMNEIEDFVVKYDDRI